jgi:hypothetical protein
MESGGNKGWSPYIAGALSGVLLVLSVLVAGEFFGASTSFVRSAGLIEAALAPEHVSGSDYFSKVIPKIDWQWMFVAGILIGSFLSSVSSGTFQLRAVPDMWAGRFGMNRVTRSTAAFTGGIIAMFGARLAGG